MAADIPVKDVLCEAMEYLVKLGSNLRTRSENLKEKKIRKDKLTNSLAVQKAADKVLLICELSKKSLANVETGVRKVLEQLVVSQASSSVGGKSSKSRTDDPKYYYFDYKSRKLKIRKKISIKHYMSVKVHANKMAMSMLDKYPVHHDCKLYRLRRRKKQATTCEVNLDNVDEEPNKSCIESDKDKSTVIILKNLEPIDSLKDNVRKVSIYSDETKSPHQFSDKNEDSNDSILTGKKKNIKKIRLIASDDSSEYESNPKNKRKKELSSTKNESCYESGLKKRKLNSSESKSKNHNTDEILSLDSDDDMQNESKKVVEDIDDSKSESNKMIENENDLGNNSKTPTIKCVSLTKLLRPDVLEKNIEVQLLTKDKKKRATPSKHSQFNVAKKDEMLKTQKKNKDIYWAQKRKEVSSFKPKEFMINIVRLPKLCTKFLLKNNLTKVTQGGESICELNKDSNDKSGNRAKQSDDNLPDPDEELIAEANKVKTSLLNESDSDDMDTFSKQNEKETTVDKIKSALLNSDSDQNEDSDTAWRQKKPDNNTSSKGEKPAKTNEKDVNSSYLDNENGNSDNGLKSNKPQNPRKEKKKLNSDKEKHCDKDPKSDEEKHSDRESNSEGVKHSDGESISEDGKPSDRETNSEGGKYSDRESNSGGEKHHGRKSNSEEGKHSDSDSKTDEERNSDKNLEKDDSDNNEKVKSDSEQNNTVKDSEAAKSDLTCKSYSDNSENSNNTPEKEMQKTTEKKSIANISESPSGSSEKGKATPHSEKKRREDSAKKALLRYSSDSGSDHEQLTNTLNKINESPSGSSEKEKATPHPEKKRREDSAKKALLRYSSDSGSDHEQLTNTLNKIKKSLLDGMSDEENKIKTNKLDEKRRSSAESSSSVSDIIKKVKKKRSNSEKSSRSKRKKRRIIHDSDDSKNNETSEDEDVKSRSHIRKKMVRSKAKPGNSSSHSSDTQDPNDKDIDGLTNLRTLNQPRRRNSDSSDKTQSSGSRAKSKMAAPTGLIGEDILKAESSSETGSNDEEEEVVEEDLEPVTIPEFNGDVEHLAKDDLLGESDSSLSNKDGKDDSEEERLNAKRRKANAISSDSEASTARKKVKDEDVRLSGFEDSEDSEPTRKTKRNKKGSDSEGSGNSSEGAAKKKRRRIKTIDDSDESGSDSENEGKNKHGRKNIRKVMGKNQLEEATKKAAREEKERLVRIAERQKMYNNVQFDESGKPDEVILDKVVLDFDPETKEPLIAVDRGLVKKLKPHQANGIKFMWDACFESVKRIKKDKGSGCILAHCMGLGKTLQVVTLTHTLLAHDSLTKVHRVLVVCPLSTVLNWVNEFKMWLKYAEDNSEIDVYELSRYKQNSERAFQLSQWFEHGGVCVLGYEMFRNLSQDNNKKFKKKMLKNFQESLVDPGPDLVVCDEGHLLKNEKTSLSQSMNRVKTLRRIVLTGTPLQNNLKEYYCMVQFVKPNLLGKYNEYLNRFVNPITNGQYTDSTEHDIKIMKRRSHVLHKMLDGAVQRRDYGVLAPFLPPKHEYVLFITLTEMQTKLYQYYLDNYSRRPLAGKSSGFLFPDFQSLQRIWTHPLVLKYNSERYEIMQQKKRDKEEEEESEGSLVDFIDDDSTPDESTSQESSDDSSGMSDDSRKKSKKKKANKKSKGKDKDKESTAAARRRGTRANPVSVDLAEDDKDVEILEVKNDNPTEWWIKMVEEDELEDMRNSHKLILLFDILRQCEAIGDKLLVFSQSLYSLDLIEHFLGKVDEATQEARIDEKLGGHVGSWSPGVDYFRLDGSTSCENRSIWCKNFNREDNPRARLFLISTRAGGLGINLVAANRVVIFDVSWNPSHDVQSIFRVYRFGQKKPCYVYRFLAMGTMEEKIYERQVTKQAISKRVIDEQQIDRHYAENDLAELYKFEPTPPSPRPLPPLPKDRLFAEMLREHEAQIYKYHEHDSLLENKEEETLSEEERKAAWEDFENEKTRPPPAPFPSPFMHNGLGHNPLLQQQYAYAALAQIIRKDMPNISDHQLRDMLPMIYNTNPSIVQKLFNTYIPQMNPLMAAGAMNPSMNAGGAGGLGGMSGVSGLQYEPPWQRQQQQQQQMRLHQLMQQQNQMGAKLYAGGLGSRDPVAMALQQQRAREIMMGGGAAAAAAGAGAGAGRPRGRPPLQPRLAPPAHAAPTAAGDVVNLDSD